MRAALWEIAKLVIWIGSAALAAACFAMTGLYAGAHQFVNAGLFGVVGIVVVVIMAFIYEAAP